MAVESVWYECGCLQKWSCLVVVSSDRARHAHLNFGGMGTFQTKQYGQWTILLIWIRLTFEQLEGTLENKFRWLLNSREQTDLEKGDISQAQAQRSVTTRFSAFGKKRTWSLYIIATGKLPSYHIQKYLLHTCCFSRKAQWETYNPDLCILLRVRYYPTPQTFSRMK